MHINNTHAMRDARVCTLGCSGVRTDRLQLRCMATAVRSCSREPGGELESRSVRLPLRRRLLPPRADDVCRRLETEGPRLVFQHPSIIHQLPLRQRFTAFPVLTPLTSHHLTTTSFLA